MGNIKILIVEDEELYADQLEMLVDKLGYDHIDTLSDYKSVLSLLETDIPDLILMDIHIDGDYDGIELTTKIRESHQMPIIFITSLRDEMTFKRASRTGATHFIIKPFDELQLQRAIELTVHKLTSSQDTPEDWQNDLLVGEHFFIKHMNKLEKVPIDQILYIESDAHYCDIHLESKKYLLRMSLAQFVNRLPKNRFIQTHRSFVVNKSKIDAVDLKDSVVKVGTKTVPLSKRNRPLVINELGNISD